ncbi:MAG: PqqD family protein [Pirellulales bacterium]
MLYASVQRLEFEIEYAKQIMALTTSVPLLISQQFDSEVVLANYQNGVYYNLDGSAAQIWLGLKAGRTVEEIAAAFTASDRW